MFYLPKEEIDISYFDLVGDDSYEENTDDRCYICDSRSSEVLICDNCKRPVCRYCLRDALGTNVANVIYQRGLCICPDCFEEDQDEYLRYFYTEDDDIDDYEMISQIRIIRMR